MVEGKVMNKRRSSPWLRALRGGVAAGLFFLLVGDRGTAAVVCGIDPLEILKLQIKNNVAVVLDTSGSMKWPVDVDNFSVGGDDPMSRLYQAKQALKAVVGTNSTRLNIGLLTYNIASNLKPLNQGQDFDNDANNGSNTNRNDGPFIYVSADAPSTPSNAAAFYTTFNCNGSGTNVDGYFCQIDDAFNQYDNANSTEIFRSFGNRRGTAIAGSSLFSDPYPAGCTPGTDCRYYLQSRLFRSNVSYTWRGTSPSNVGLALVSGPNAFACPLPPVGIVGDNPDLDSDGFSDKPTPCMQFINQATGLSSVFYYTSAIFELASGSVCGGALTINAVPPCTTDTTQVVLDALAQELPVVSATKLNGNLTANAVQDYMNRAGSNPTGDNPPFGPGPPIAGVRADQSTPIAGSIQYIRTAAPPVFPPLQPPPPIGPLQKNFVLILSDGDDTCANANPDTAAALAARQAQLLFENTGNPQNQAETLFVAFASAINIGRSNKIAQAGSGGQVGPIPPGNVTCPPGAVCRNAFTANSTDELIAVLNAALDLIVSEGEFSAAPTIISTVFELGVLSDPLNISNPGDPARVDSMNPDTRYNSRTNILFQPTFELPGFTGHLYAFLNDGTFQQVNQANFTGRWDAGETLFEQVSQLCLEIGNEGHGVNLYRFTELHDGLSARNINAASCSAGGNVTIRRRIFTASPVAGTGGSPVNRTYTRTAGVLNEWDGSVAQGTNVVALWPPNQTGLDSGITDIDPAAGVVGPLDDALGIGPASIPLLTFSDLRSKLRACEGSLDSGGAPAACDDIVNPALALQTARKEGRQILLTWMAGAKVALGSDNKALRDASDPVNKPLLFTDRGWIMGDTTLAAPAIVGPPLRGAPSEHLVEFALFRDGRRSSVDQQGIDDLDRGFGLRNPDFDDADPATKPNLKPTMTVVYHPANDMLHAFRAGPDCGPDPGVEFKPLTPPASCTEMGSQELWGFVPFDQLGKIMTLLQGQLQDPHTYMMGTSVRVADIFIPGTFSLVDNGISVNYDGRWRTVLFVGRGPGGKFYTAIDVTGPGPFTRAALDTNPPFVMWNIGNEAPVAGVDPTSDDDYDGMGESWSVPAVGNVDVVTAGLPEWRVWVGSGCGSDPTNFEGKCFFMLDAETGANAGSSPFVVGDGNTTYIPDNALVAGPSAYNAFQLDDPTVLTRSLDRVTRIYIPDIHGRIWKFNTTSGGLVADEGPAQPFGVPVALMKIDAGQGALPHIFAAAGNDLRVPDTNPFKMFGYSDGGADTDLTTQLTKLFNQSFAAPVPGISEGTRGTVQPATAFNDQGQGRVFFVGTRFNFTDITCISSFDTFLFGLGAVSGSAVYDFNNDGTLDLSTIIQGVRATVLQTAGGQVLIGDSGGIGRAPSPPPPPASPFPSPAAAQPSQVLTTDMKPGSPVCRVQ